MLIKIICIQILCIHSLFTFEIPSNCWIGNDEVRVDLLCPEYVGNGKTSCCGEPASRYCCTREQFEEEAKSREKENPVEIIEEKFIIMKSDTEATKTIEYGEIKLQSDDKNFNLESFKVKVIFVKSLIEFSPSPDIFPLTFVISKKELF